MQEEDDPSGNLCKIDSFALDVESEFFHVEPTVKQPKETAYQTAQLVRQLDQFLTEKPELRAFPPSVTFASRVPVSDRAKASLYCNAESPAVAL